MKKTKMANKAVNDIKSFLLRVGMPVYDNGKCIYYVDYNGKPRKLTRQG